MKIAVSACLLGEPCRYDGRSKPCSAVRFLAQSHEIVAICPEVMGGLPVPRTRSEIQKSAQGVRVVDEFGINRTEPYLKGAQAALTRVQEAGCELAILKAKSPACGVGEVYDGTFSGKLVQGSGVAARAFMDAGIKVLDEIELERILLENDGKLVI